MKINYSLLFTVVFSAFIQLPANNTAHMFIPTKPNVSYKVQQVHFHWGFKSNEGSEHTIGNDKFPIEVYLLTYNYLT